MPTGLDSYNSLKAATANLPAGGEHWISVTEKLDLCKLTTADLISLHFNEQSAETVAAALDHQDVAPLGNAMGISLHVKFRVMAERNTGIVRLRCDDQQSAEWLQTYLHARFPNSQISDPQPCDNSMCFDVTLDGEATLVAVRQSLLECPAATIVRLFDVRIAEQPHYRIEAFNLAAWLEDQDNEEPWWTVDGDPLLMSRLEFPAPPDELAEVLRKIDKPLLVADPTGSAAGEELTPEEVDDVVSSDEWGNRMLGLSWENGSNDWQLIEDEPTSESSSE